MLKQSSSLEEIEKQEPLPGLRAVETWWTFGGGCVWAPKEHSFACAAKLLSRNGRNSEPRRRSVSG
jgi:hypothetical protein